MPETVLTVLAHPDDAEFLCIGTVIRLVKEHGWHCHIASMTAGDCGSAEHSPDEISRIRRAEGQAAADIIWATYHCLGERDLLITYGERTLDKVTRLMRQVRPRIVISHNPADYMVDHEVTSTVTRAAAFAAPAPNFLSDHGHAPPIPRVPHLYYCDPVQGKNLFGEDATPGFYVDVSGVIEIKEAMLARHASQREWLRRHHGIEMYLTAMREWTARQGQQCGVAFAEGFRQHLGHGYPDDNLLEQLLGAKTR